MSLLSQFHRGGWTGFVADLIDKLPREGFFEDGLAESFSFDQPFLNFLA